MNWETIEHLSHLQKKYMITANETVFCHTLESTNDSHRLPKCVALEENHRIEKCMEVIGEKISKLVNTLQLLVLDQPSCH